MPRGERYKFPQDYAFASPSTAAGVIVRRENGRVCRKDEAGRAPKQLQEAQSPT